MNPTNTDLLDALGSMDAIEQKKFKQAVYNEKYKFSSSGFKQECAEQGEVCSDELVYFNQRDPQVTVLHETPIHRQMIMLRLRGLGMKEIAEATGYSYIHVSNVLRQPWAVKRMAKLQHEVGVGELQTTIERLGKKALTVIEDLIDTAENESVKNNAAQYAINRLLGKPKESLVIADSRSADELSNDELAKIAAQATSTMTAGSQATSSEPATIVSN